jgi:predicted fused transcriptional regulator/phosphomethylpyrimidine kinase
LFYPARACSIQRALVLFGEGSRSTKQALAVEGRLRVLGKARFLEGATRLGAQAHVTTMVRSVHVV